MKRTLTPAVLAVASSLVLAACGEPTEPGDTDSTTTATDTVTSAPATTDNTETTGTTTVEAEGEIAAEHNNADVMFARMMIPHHQQAVEMSEILLAKDDIPAQVTEFARGVIDTQAREIEQMDTMLDVWGQQPGSGPMGGMGPDDRGNMGGMGGMGGMGSGGMGGMMNREGLAALDNAQGGEAVRLYLEHMIPHHEGAIDMARNEVNNGRNPQAIDLAEQMITTQEAEIAEMEQMLQNL